MRSFPSRHTWNSGKPRTIPRVPCTRFVAAVRARQVGVVLEDDRDPVGGPDQAGVHVAVDVLADPLGMALGEVLLRVEVQPARLGAHRHQVLQAIAAVDVQVPRQRPQAVHRVEVAVPLGEVGPQPEPVAVVADLQVARVVLVGALGVDQLAQEPGADHPQDGHLLAHVVDVLHHHAVLAGLLGGLDELPAFVQGDRGGDLGGGVLAVAHRGEADRDVPLPGGGGVDQVEVLGRAHPLEVALAAGVGRRLPLAQRRGLAAGGGAGLLADVAHGLQLHAVEAQQVGHVLRPLDPDADEADADRLDRLAPPDAGSPATDSPAAAPPSAAAAPRPAPSLRKSLLPLFVSMECVPGPREDEARRLIL